MKNEIYSIEEFSLDPSKFGEFAELISISFLNDEAAQKEGASIYFTKETFKLIFDAPSSDKKLFIRALYKPTKQLVGFLGLVPRVMSINGKEYKFAIPAWLCVHPAHQRQGLAKKMAQKLLEIAKREGYEGGYALHEPEQHGIDVSQAISRKEGVSFHRVATLNKFIIRIFDVKTVALVVKLRWYEQLALRFFQKVHKVYDDNIRQATINDTEQIHSLLLEHISRNQLAIVSQRTELKWMLSNPLCINLVYEKNGKIEGFVLAWEFFLAGFGNRLKFGWLDKIHTHNLTRKEATSLFKKLCIIAKERGWYGLQTPYFPYFDPKPLKKANFIFFPKTLTVDFFDISGIELPENVNKCYLDWR